MNYEEFQEKGDEAFHESTPDGNDKECYINLPKEALLGIAIGYKSADKLEDVESYLQQCGFDIAKVKIQVCELDTSHVDETN